MSIRNNYIAPAGWILLTVTLFALVLSAPTMRPGEETVASGQELGYFTFEKPAPLEHPMLVGTDGEVVDFSSATGRWRILFFGFTTCPDVCPTTLSVLNHALQDLDAPPEVLMVTLDPERDEASRLEAYVRAFNPAFRAVTGSVDAIDRFASQFGIRYEKIFMEDGRDYLVEHSGVLVVLSPDGRHAGYIRPPLRVDHLQRIAAGLGAVNDA